MSGILMVAGIHGVGKSTACEYLSSRFLIPSFTASQIIRKEAQAESGFKITSDIKKNQELLLKGINRLLNQHQTIILDGHFTLISAEREIERVDADVFKKLPIAGILLLKNSPEVIAERTVFRDGKALPIDIINLHQKAEEQYAIEIGNMLNISVNVLNGFEESDLFKAFSAMLKI